MKKETFRTVTEARLEISNLIEDQTSFIFETSSWRSKGNRYLCHIDRDGRVIATEKWGFWTVQESEHVACHEDLGSIEIWRGNGCLTIGASSGVTFKHSLIRCNPVKDLDGNVVDWRAAA